MIYRASPQSGQIFQGEIVSNLTQAWLDIASIGPDRTPVVNFFTHPYAVVLTQGCDLESDFRRRRAQETTGLIPSILFCEIAEAVALQHGEGLNSGIWRHVRKNKEERYHFLRGIGPEADAAGQGTPDLALDFKRYFTVPTGEAYWRLEVGELKRRACLESPYREHLATRFFYYHYRVALPEDHFVRADQNTM